MKNLPNKVNQKERLKKIKEERKKRIQEEKAAKKLARKSPKKNSAELAVVQDNQDQVNTLELGNSKFSFSSIRGQLALSFGLIGLLLIAIVGITVSYFSDVEKQHNELSNQKSTLMRNLLALDKDVKESSLLTMNYINSGIEQNLKDRNYLWKQIKVSVKQLDPFVVASNNEGYLQAFNDYSNKLNYLKEIQESIIEEEVSLNESSYYLTNMKQPIDLIDNYTNRANYNSNRSSAGRQFFELIDSIRFYTKLYNQKALEVSLINSKNSFEDFNSANTKLESLYEISKQLRLGSLSYYSNSLFKINQELDNLLILSLGFQEEFKKKNGKLSSDAFVELSNLHEGLDGNAKWILDKEELEIINQTKALSSRLVFVRNLEYIFLGIGLLIAIVLAYLSIKRIVQPIQKLRDVFAEMTKGVLPDQIKANNNEIGDVIKATNIFVDGLKETANFANSIGEGKLEEDYEPLSKDDNLGLSLLEMREKLKEASEQDKIREWKVQGVTRFSELLRQNSADIESFGFNIVMELTKNIGADQGAIFSIEENNDEGFLKMIGCYAFERRKYIDREILKGEGLVGQCWQEKDIIHLTEIPKTYMKIKSGLGEAQPAEVIVVPLIEANEIYGVIEIASFNKIEEYKIEYIQELCESIASTLKGIKINVQTQKLLTESKEMTESMRSQEEELRQTAEEMQATTEDLEQRLREEKAEAEARIKELQDKIRTLEGR